MAAKLTRAQAKVMLERIGFNNADKHFSAAVQGFQIGWAFDDELATTSGFFDQSTSDALRKSYKRLK